ncbi:MAG: tetratricopeptide repeat protein [Magnetococcales bacterium]|nr:tetratricopeptide repeat protein [Magnetococcales bacterium]
MSQRPSTMTVAEAMGVAVNAHQNGELEQAEHLYRQILALDPNQVDALRLVGVLAHQTGRLEEAEHFLKQALLKNPDLAPTHANLGHLRRDMERYDEAIACFRKALTLQPDDVGLMATLGALLLDRGELAEAEPLLRKALVLQPRDPGAHNNLGNLLLAQGHHEEAVDHFRQVMELMPEAPEPLANLAQALDQMGDQAGADLALDRALQLRPDHVPFFTLAAELQRRRGDWEGALVNLRRILERVPEHVEANFHMAEILARQGHPEQAERAFQRCIQLDPSHVEAHNVYGVLLKDLGRLEEAAAYFEKAIVLQADHVMAHANLGVVCLTQGLLDSASVCFDRALAFDDGKDTSVSQTLARNRVSVMLYQPGIDHEALFEAYTKLVQDTWPDDLTDQPFYAQEVLMAAPERLRVGYLSSDFREHPVGNNLRPLLENHDHEKVEIFCYADLLQEDEESQMFRGLAHQWRDIHGLSDRQAAEQIAGDGIHIMVYLAGHFDRNRDRIAAYRPAPVQASYYSATTSAIERMDIWFTDQNLHPKGESVERFTEKLTRLPSLYIYPMPEEAPEPGPPPVVSHEYITFGSFNSPTKISDHLLALWAQILIQTPDARLVLKYRNLLKSPAIRERIIKGMSQHGIRKERLSFLSASDDSRAHFARYQSIDIALDTFPFNGATTTFQALWMGVPVITLWGDRFLSRMGADLVTQVGLAELAADSEEDYVALAVELAGDRERLAALRAGLRARVAVSPLCDGAAYSKVFEKALAKAWKKRRG